jgi:Tfp pilus assembly protein PilX
VPPDDEQAARLAASAIPDTARIGRFSTRLCNHTSRTAAASRSAAGAQDVHSRGDGTAEPCQNLSVRYRILAPIALIVLFAAACTGSTAPAPNSPVPRSTSINRSRTASDSKTPTGSTPMTTSASSVPFPRPPDTASQHTASGARAFGVYFIRAFSWGYRATSSRAVRAYFANSCKECARFAAIFDRARRRQEHLRGGRIRVSSVRDAGGSNKFGSNQIVDVVFSQAPIELMSKTGRILRRDPGSHRTTYRLWLRSADEGWNVVDLRQVVSR